MTLCKSVPNQEIGFQVFRKGWKAILRRERNTGNSVYPKSLSFNHWKTILEASYEHKVCYNFNYNMFVVLKTIRNSYDNAMQILLVFMGISTHFHDNSKLFYWWFYWRFRMDLYNLIHTFSYNLGVCFLQLDRHFSIQ